MVPECVADVADQLGIKTRIIPVGDHAGVIVGTANEPHTIRLMPPLTTTDAEIDAFLEAFAHALADG